MSDPTPEAWNPDGTRRPTKSKSRPKNLQPNLFDSGLTAKQTKCDAYTESKVTEPTRRQQIVTHVTDSGAEGVTRESLSLCTGIKIQSVCGAVLGLLRDGVLVEDGRTRPTESGRSAAVIVLGGRNDGSQ
jgi:hypothetical protein